MVGNDDIFALLKQNPFNPENSIFKTDYQKLRWD